MKKLLLFFICTMLLSNCVPNNTKENNVKEETTSAPINDTVLFKYVLGSSKQQVELRTDSLIKEKSIEKLTNKYYTMTMLGHSADFKETGYPCNLYIGKTAIKALMSFKFHNDTLIRQSFFTIYDDPRSSLYDIYGKPTKVDNYIKDMNNRVDTYWKVGGDKAVYVVEYSGFYNLHFDKISLVDKFIREERENEQLMKKLVEEDNIEKSQNMGW